MFDELLPRLRTPLTGLTDISIDRSQPLVRTADGALQTATLVGPDGADPSQVTDGLWEAMGGARPPRTLAQLSNVIPPTPQLYEAVWRKRSLTLLARRPFPILEELGELDAALPDVDGAVCVDLGCSEGLYARHLAARGALVLAVDHSRPFLRRARKRAAAEGVRVALVRATAQRLPVADAAVDAVVIGGSLNEIGDRPAAIGEAARIVRPGGTMFVMSLLRATSRRGRMLQRLLGPSGIDFTTTEQSAAEFEAAGFTVADRRVDGIVARTTLLRRS